MIAYVDRMLSSDFWGLSASVLGVYEALAFVTGRQRFPTLSTFCARTERRRALLALWTLGLGAHIWRHKLEAADG